MDDMKLRVFENDEFGTVRTDIDENGKVLFCASDVAKALGYSNPRDAVGRHCKGVVKRDGVSITTNQYGTQTKQTTSMSFILEGDVYRLIVSSKLPTAEKFERWVFDEVLPDIRQHGMYMTGEALNKFLSDPRGAIQLLTAYADEKEKNARLEQEKALLVEENEVMKPKATYYDMVLASTNAVNITQIAKDYGMSAVKFNSMLSDMGIQYKTKEQWVLYQQYADQGYTESMTACDKLGNSHMHTQWTQKGGLFLYDKLKDSGILPAMERT